MVNLPENSSINIFKGVLILLVIIGHILIGPLNDNFIRFIIYSFHMPLFFFISGYLIKFDKLKMMSLKEFAEKYTKRLLKGWSVAWIIYTLLILNTQISIKSLIQYTVYNIPILSFVVYPNLVFHVPPFISSFKNSFKKNNYNHWSTYWNIMSYNKS